MSDKIIIGSIVRASGSAIKPEANLDKTWRVEKITGDNVELVNVDNDKDEYRASIRDLDLATESNAPTQITQGQKVRIPGPNIKPESNRSKLWVVSKILGQEAELVNAADKNEVVKVHLKDVEAAVTAGSQPYALR